MRESSSPDGLKKHGELTTNFFGRPETPSAQQGGGHGGGGGGGGAGGGNPGSSKSRSSKAPKLPKQKKTPLDKSLLNSLGQTPNSDQTPPSSSQGNSASAQKKTHGQPANWAANENKPTDFATNYSNSDRSSPAR